MSFKNFLTGINRTGEQLINSVIQRPPGGGGGDNDSTNQTSDQPSSYGDIRPSSATSTTTSVQDRRDSYKSSSSTSSSANNNNNNNSNNNHSESNPNLAHTTTPGEGDIVEAEGFLCPQCMAAFPNPELLTEHFSVIHSPMFDNVVDSSMAQRDLTPDGDIENLVQCVHCRMKFINEERLLHHMQQYHRSELASVSDDNPQQITTTTMTLDEQSTALLTENFSRAIQSAFANESAAAATATSDQTANRIKNEKSEELELLANQLKVMEETKDILLTEMAAMREQLAKKDELIGKLNIDKQSFDLQVDARRKLEELANKNQIEENQQELARLCHENEMLSTSNSLTNDTLKETRQKFTEQLEMINIELISKKNELAKVCVENEQYKVQIKEKIPLLTSQLGTPLEALLEEKKQLSAVISELETKLNRKQNDCDGLCRQLDSYRAKLAKSKDSTLQQLEVAESDRVNELNRQIDELGKNIDSLRTERVSMEKAVRDLSDQNSNLKNELVGSRLRFENLQLEATHSQTKLAVTEQKFKETMDELDGKRTELVRIRQQTKELEERHNTELQEENQQNQQLQTLIDRLQPELEQSKDELVSSQLIISNLRETLNQINEQHRDLTEKLQKELKESKEEVTRLDVIVENNQQTLEQTREQHHTQIEQLKLKFEDLSTNSDKQIDELNTKLAATETELQIQQSKLANVQKLTQEEAERLQSGIEERNSIIKNLSLKLNKLQTFISNFIQCELGKLSSQRTELYQLVQSQQEQLSQFIGNCSVQISDSLCKQHRVVSTVQHKLTTENGQLRQKYRHLSEVTLPQKDIRIGELLESGKQIQADRDLIRTELEQLQNRETINREKFAGIKTENVQLLAQIEKEKARFENAQHFNDQTLSEKLKLELELSTNSEEKRNLLERCIANEEQLKVALVEINDLSSKLEENSKAVFELGQQNQNLQIELDEATRRLKPNWINDRLVTQCMNDKCHKTFGAVLRKHHCRRCGNIFCNECSLKTGQVTGHPKPVRVCDLCYDQIKLQ